MSRANRISLRMVGRPEDNGDVRIGAFLKKIDALRDALRATDKVMSDGEVLFDYRVVDLSHSSPSTVQVEPVPLEMEAVADAGPLVDTFHKTVEGIQEGSGVPEGFDYFALQKFKRLEPTERDTPAVEISHNGDWLSLSGEWAKNVDTILGPDQYEVGSATGMLQALNVHGGNKKFSIYPIGEPELRCRFGPELRDDVVKAVDRYVEVFGRLRYKAGGRYPHAMDAHRIEVYPDEAELPTLDDLFGIAPDITGEKPAEDFVRDLRDEW